MNAIHISTAQAMMLRPDPVDLVVFKSDGSLVHYPNVISLKFDFYKGTRTIKFLRSNEIRTVRDVCISKINGLEVFLSQKTRFSRKKSLFLHFFKTCPK